MSRIPAGKSSANNRIPGELPGVGIAQATYDAAVAKLVTVSEWLDLTATITTACAGAAASDPDSLAAGLTVTTSTGTFDGETIPCNEFAWTTHTTTNDGHGETLNYDLGTIASLIPGYDPATHGIEIDYALAATGTLNSAQPILAVVLAPNGTLDGTASHGAVFQVTSATSVATYGYLATGNVGNIGLTPGNPSAVAVGGLRRMLGIANGGVYTAFVFSHIRHGAGSSRVHAAATGQTRTTGDKLILCLGQATTTQGAVSALKARFRVRVIERVNLDLSDLDLGCFA